ncbi:MAG: ATP-binding protein [Candidatus Pacebacteria bacterium]|nr:ATP-binding protein [Candidatus Paceibacterota bacterium]
MNPLSIPPILSSILFLFLGGFVFFKNRKSGINFTFLLICITTSWWQLSWFFLFNTRDVGLAEILVKIGYIGIIFLPVTFLRFSITFLEKKDKFNKITLYLSYFVALAFEIILFSTNYFINGYYKFFWGFYPKANFLHPFFLLFIGVLLVRVIYLFFVEIKKGPGFFLKKSQTKYILTAIIFYAFASSDFLINYGHEFYPFGFIPILIFLGIIGYAIVKYRLMDLRFVLGRSAIYLFSFISVILLAVLLLFGHARLWPAMPLNVVSISILIIGIIVFQPIFRFFENLAAKYFYYTFYSYQTVFADLGRRLTQFLELDKLTSLIANTLVNTMKLDRTVILLRETGSGEYKIQKNVGFKEENGISLVKDNFLTTYLERTQKSLVYEELLLIIRDAREASEKEKLEYLRENMKKIEASLCIPLFMEDKIIGMIVLGNKISGDPYSEQDVQLLTNLSNQASIALQNAKLYGQVQDLSKNLQRKVDEQTKELRVAYEELKTLDKAKSEFISMASHQLRTPLAAIKGYVSMLIEGSFGPISDKAKEKLTNVTQSNERLIKMVNDLLDISKIDLGKMETEKSKMQVLDLVGSCIEELEHEVEKKNLKLTFEKPKIALPKIEVDALKIRQVFLNLIDNAIRYTTQGEILIKAKKKKSSILFSIKDTGEGLTKEELENIFQGFSRGSAGIDLFIEGTGLGLYVAKKFLELHQGKIWAESKGKGKGATFFVELPME